MIMAKVKFNVILPQFNFQKDLREVADNIFIPRMQEGINNGTAIDGGNFPALEPATIRRKSGAILKRTFTKKGNLRSKVEETIGKTGLVSFSNKTLIETGKLLASFYSRNVGKRSVLISLSKKRKKVGEALQIDGVGNKKKHFNFFGISQRMEREAIEMMKNKINESLKNGRATKLL